MSTTSNEVTEDRYVLAAETLWESARRYMADGWKGRPDEFVAEVKAMRAEVRAEAIEACAKAAGRAVSERYKDDLEAEDIADAVRAVRP